MGKSGDQGQKTGEPETRVHGAALETLQKRIKELEDDRAHLQKAGDKLCAENIRLATDLERLEPDGKHTVRGAHPMAVFQHVVEALLDLDPDVENEEDADLELPGAQAHVLATVIIHLGLAHSVIQKLPIPPRVIAEYVQAVVSPKPEPSR